MTAPPKPPRQMQYWPARGRRRLRLLLRLLPVLLVLGGIALVHFMGWRDLLTLDQLAAQRDTLKGAVAAHPLGSLAAYVCIYAVVTLLSLPVAALMTIAAGFLFGWITGALAAIIGATIGATLLFLLARSAFGSFLRERIRGKAAVLAEGFERNAFTFLLALRLAPVLPFFVVNIVPAIFHVPLRTFLAATLIGILPGGLAYAWLGQGLDSVLLAAASTGRPVTLRDLVTPQILIAFAALAIVATLPGIVKGLRQRTRR